MTLKTGLGLPYGEKNYGNTLNRFHSISERNGQTERLARSVARVSMLTRDKDLG